MKATVWILTTAVALISLASGCKTSGSAAPVKPGDAGTQPLFKPEPATLAQQKMCDEQAEKRFKDWETTALYYGSKPLYSYTSHYDPTVNVCFIRVHTFGANPASVSDTVFDAFGGRVYATYIWSNPQNKNYYDVSPSECDVQIPGKPEEKCTSNTEFDDLTDRYFGVTK